MESSSQSSSATAPPPSMSSQGDRLGVSSFLYSEVLRLQQQLLKHESISPIPFPQSPAFAGSANIHRKPRAVGPVADAHKRTLLGMEGRTERG